MRLLVALVASVAARGLELGRRPVVFVTPEGWCAAEDTARLVGVCESAAAGGADVVQLRDPSASREALVRAGRAVVRALAASACVVVVNGDCGVAVDAAADGAHLPERVLAGDPRAAAAARRRLRVVGCSAHSVEAALRGATLGADYVQLGTMFETATHPGKVPEGPALAAAVARAFDGLPPEGHRPRLVGVGGVDATNAGALAAAGCDGVAVIRSVARARDPAAAVRAVRRALGEGARGS